MIISSCAFTTGDIVRLPNLFRNSFKKGYTVHNTVQLYTFTCRAVPTNYKDYHRCVSGSVKFKTSAFSYIVLMPLASSSGRSFPTGARLPPHRVTSVNRFTLLYACSPSLSLDYSLKVFKLSRILYSINCLRMPFFFQYLFILASLLISNRLVFLPLLRLTLVYDRCNYFQIYSNLLRNTLNLFPIRSISSRNFCECINNIYFIRF